MQHVKFFQVLIPPSDNPKFARPHSIDQWAAPYEVPLIKDMWIEGLHPAQLADIEVNEHPYAATFDLDPYVRVTSLDHERKRLQKFYNVRDPNRFARVFPGDTFDKMYAAAIADEAEVKAFRAEMVAKQNIAIRENLERSRPLDQTASGADIDARIAAAVSKALAEHAKTTAAAAASEAEPAKRGPGRPPKTTSDT